MQQAAQRGAMPDQRFFRRAGPFSLDAICELIGAEEPGPGDGALLIFDIAPLEDAGPGDISSSPAGGTSIRSDLPAPVPSSSAWR
jgi:hypothetical protein